MAADDAAPSGENVRALPRRGTTPYRRNRLTFRTAEELAVYDEIERQRQAFYRFDTFGVMAGVPIRVEGHTFTIDLVVTHRGSCAGIEVDGSVHQKRWGHDRSRDALLEDAGILFVARIDNRDVTDQGSLRIFVERFLHRLRERRAG